MLKMIKGFRETEDKIKLMKKKFPKKKTKAELRKTH